MCCRLSLINANKNKESKEIQKNPKEKKTNRQKQNG